MQKKFEFDNVFSLNVFDDIKGELKVKHPNIKFFINKEKFYFVIEAEEQTFEEDKKNVLNIIYQISNLLKRKQKKYIEKLYI